MSKNKDQRPQWFKFWRRNRGMLDVETLSMEARGRIFTNIMRYFDCCNPTFYNKLFYHISCRLKEVPA